MKPRNRYHGIDSWPLYIVLKFKHRMQVGEGRQVDEEVAGRERSQTGEKRQAQEKKRKSRD
jgi:hypothetical protein